MREETTLQHDTVPVGRLWDASTETGNYDNWGRKPITTIVLHSMDGTTDGSTAWFKKTNRSAHYGISKDGKITLWIPENCVAYNAGKYSVNQEAIGIECEDGGDNQAERTPEQLEKLALLVADICAAYNIPADADHIKIHKEIVATACPGNLPRDLIVERAKQMLSEDHSPEEQLHPYQMYPSVFMNMVMEGTEYKELFKDLDLDVKLAKNKDSHEMVIQCINRKVTAQVEAHLQNDAGNQSSTVSQTEKEEEVLTEQEKSILFMSIPEIFAKLKMKLARSKA